ncbi:RNA polymerase-associated protein RTF1 homolog [Toxorhynchites rutilus septentrionalis]|uniref:RNA polymerase-associated protein RTF1 homolog n=1 Tax=Toxorhynchites rutilus septentrionalis TaxID=329112 RepID=UPI00247981CB|nr:RNA polymerase-associated protein RTF1 homolog [Toxorhynchites rutilus septentrionalis]
MNKPGSNLDQNETAYNCGSCDRPDHDESLMVYCESCERWFHFTCQQVTSDVKDDDTWVCTDCSASGGNPDPPEITDPVDAELAEAEKALARERELFQKQLKKRMELAKMKLKLEKEKREMEWEFEKQEMKMRIATEEEFNRKRQIEKDWMQRKLDSVINERSVIEESLKKKKDKTKSKPVDKSLRLTGATSSEFSVGKPSSSTPLEDRRVQIIRKSGQTNLNHEENDRETPRRRSARERER